MLGDNSPQSKDSRGWDSNDRDWDTVSHRETWEVPRCLLTGKAFFVYWPHGVPFGRNIAVGQRYQVAVSALCGTDEVDPLRARPEVAAPRIWWASSRG